MDDLSLVPIKDLLDELCSRFDHAVFAACRETNDGKLVTKRRFKGNPATFIGLAYLAQHLAACDWEADREDVDNSTEM